MRVCRRRAVSRRTRARVAGGGVCWHHVRVGVSLVERLPAAVAGGVRLLGPAARAGLARVFGPPFDPRRDDSDLGLFGPGSASWRIIGDLASIVGGLRALLVQLLHPLVVAGVAEHSSYQEEPLGRLRRTSDYVVVTTFGSTSQALQQVRRVRRIHGRVRGTAPDGRPYRASDPHLIAWVSIALTSSFLATDQAYASQPVDAAAADRFVAEQSRLAALLDPRVNLEELAQDSQGLNALRAGRYPLPMLQEGDLPRNAAELHDRLDAYRAELGLNAESRRGLWYLLWPPLPLPLKAAYLPVLAGAVATLEPDLRRRLRLPLPWPARSATTAELRTFLRLLRIAVSPPPSKQATAARGGTN